MEINGSLGYMGDLKGCYPTVKDEWVSEPTDAGLEWARLQSLLKSC